MRWRHHYHSYRAAVFICLALVACAAPTPPDWVKAGSDAATTESELSDCHAQANARLASEEERIEASVGLNWLLQGNPVVPLQRELLLQRAAKNAEQLFNNCMRAKGFTKEA